MFRFIKSFFKNNNVIGEYLKKFSTMYITFLSFIVFFEVYMLIYGYFNYDFENHFPSSLTYLICYAGILFVSLIAIIFLLRGKKKNIKSQTYAWLIYFYVFASFLSGTTVTLFDIINGQGSEIYYLVLIIISGLILMDPYIFTFFAICSFVSLFFISIPFASYFYDLKNSLSNVFIILIVSLIAFKNHKIIMYETKIKSQLEENASTDQLTGLKNDNKYFKTIDEINSRLSLKSSTAFEFAVVIMDVNLLKKTNDKFGHHYGCHLIVETGHILPSIFNTKNLYHIGGDEFICLLFGPEINKLKELIEEFDKKLNFSKINFDGADLYLSVARGYAISNDKTLKYNDVFQKADKMMYKNKRELKKLYDLENKVKELPFNPELLYVENIEISDETEETETN